MLGSNMLGSNMLGSAVQPGINTMSAADRILVTGASGQLGRLTLPLLAKRLPAGHLAALVREPARAQDLAETGAELRQGSYDDPASLDHAFKGVSKVLFISGNEVGQRLKQHGNVIDAAGRANVKLLAYTSILHSDVSPLALTAEHRETEKLIKASGIPAVILRNGWYTENYTANIGSVLQHNAVIGCAKDGRISAAPRQDFADAAAAVLLSTDDHTGNVYELAGDASFTLAEYAAEIARQTGKPIAYHDLPEAEYKAALVKAGVPEIYAGVFSDSDAGAAKGALFNDSRTLSSLIGRPTTPLPVSVRAALKDRSVG
jgi:NAD(P)H dehydrogenase (quinone)